MKYAVMGIKQELVLKYGLDYQDLMILDYIAFCLNITELQKHLEDNKCYVGLNVNKILEDLPTLYIKERGISERLATLYNKNLIDKIIIYDKEKRIKKTYYKTSDNYERLKYGKEIIIENDKSASNESDLKEEEKKENINSELCKEIIDYLNEKTNKKYRANNKETQRHINARVNDGYKLEDFKKVIDEKCNEWKNTSMDLYLRPNTLFGNKFESYLNQKEGNVFNNPYAPQKNTYNVNKDDDEGFF